MNSNPETSEKREKGLKPTYIPRLMPVGGIVILLALLVPMLMGKRHTANERAAVEPPPAMKRYATGDGRIDSLLNEGLRAFGAENYDEAARLLTQAHFYCTVKIREGEAPSYPEDHRFFLGLAEFYRGRPDRAAPYIEEEERANPIEEKYPWYLAHIYAAEGRNDAARGKLEKVVQSGGSLAPRAREEIKGL